MSGAAAPQPSLTTRVLVVDDSAFMRRTLARILEEHDGVEVVGTARDGLEGVREALRLRPDLITMDVEMPNLDGVGAVQEIMQAVPTPIIMVSSLTTEGAEVTIDALEAGAIDYVAKPNAIGEAVPGLRDQLARAIGGWQQAKVQRRPARPPVAPKREIPKRPPTTPGGPAQRLIVIGSSTGGPPALTAVVPNLQPDPAVGVLVVQHMPAGFTSTLAQRLDSASPQPVREAKHGEVLHGGEVLIAPGDYHLELSSERRVHLNQKPARHGVRPCVDITLESVAPALGNKMSVAILTGMGQDGAEGCVAVEDAGGQIVVQDEATCVVYGMPRVAKLKTKAAIVAPIERVATELMKLARIGAPR